MIWLLLGCLEEVTGESTPLDPRYFSGEPTPPTNEGPPPNMIRVENITEQFWIDTYEYPNEAGAVPLSSTTFLQAQTLCLAEGKRLCTANEWRTACSGLKEERRFGYSNFYEEGRCYLQKALPSGHSSMMAPEEQVAKSGQKERCHTPDGVHDLIGNLEEWVWDDWKGLPGGLEGGAWYTFSQYADCSGNYSRQPDYRISIDRRIFSAGFRCCWSNYDLTQDHKSRDAIQRIKKAKEKHTEETYAPNDEIPLSKETFIDRYEYPNKAGTIPMAAVTALEADTLCEQAGKRLCAAHEWEIACGEYVYPYGDKFIPSACAVHVTELAPSGRYFGCQSSSGVSDMVGNLWEWTATTLDAPALSQGAVLREIRGGSWFVDDRKSTCQGIDGYPATPQTQAFPDVGFRCCRGPLLKREVKEKKSLTCPIGMSSGSSFCIDQFEFPNQEHAMPIGGVTLQNAKKYCARTNKRLCTELEWEEACRGWEGYRWPYGDVYLADTCIDAGGVTVEGKSGAQPSGHAIGCKSSIGTYDMSGNLWEWVAEGVLKGGGWNLSAGLGQCQASAQARENFQAGEAGLRCCSDPQ
jgi:formylglycine-generating enzyme required for sulfatase activity